MKNRLTRRTPLLQLNVLFQFSTNLATQSRLHSDSKRGSHSNTFVMLRFHVVTLFLIHLSGQVADMARSFVYFAPVHANSFTRTHQGRHSMSLANHTPICKRTNNLQHLANVLVPHPQITQIHSSCRIFHVTVIKRSLLWVASLIPIQLDIVHMPSRESLTLHPHNALH